MTKRLLAVLSLVTFLFSASTPAFAVGSSGFENASFSAYALGQSNAVTADANKEPAAISYNPAGIADLRGIQAESHGAFISAVTHIDGSHGDTSSSGTVIPVPTNYLTINAGPALNNRLVFGLGQDSPFGLANKYDSNVEQVHYSGFKNWIKMFTLKPTVAYKFTDWLSIGAGAMYYNVYDLGQILAYPNKAADPVFAGNPDGQLRAKLSGSHWGWHLGTLVKPHEKHQFGFYFRSPVKVRLKGRVKVEGSSYSDNNGNFDIGAYSNLDFPMNMTWAYAFFPTKKNKIELDFGYTRWSTFDGLKVNRTDSVNSSPLPGIDNGLLDSIGFGADASKDYQDTFSIHLGGRHQLTNKLTLMAGTLFYSVACPKEHFSPSIPDSNRIAFSLGMSYAVSKMLAVDMTFYDTIALRRTVDNTAAMEGAGGSLDGKYTSNFAILSLSMRLMWEDAFDRLAGSKPAEEEAPKDKDAAIAKTMEKLL